MVASTCAVRLCLSLRLIRKWILTREAAGLRALNATIHNGQVTRNRALVSNGLLLSAGSVWFWWPGEATAVASNARKLPAADSQTALGVQ